MTTTAHTPNHFYANSSLKALAMAGTVKCALFTSSLTPVVATDTVYGGAPYNANEVAASNGYAAGGVTCGTIACVVNSDGTHVDLTGGTNPTWTVTGAGFSYQYAVFYDTASPYNIVSVVNFGTTITVPAGTHTITLPSDGSTNNVIARVGVS